MKKPVMTACLIAAFLGATSSFLSSHASAPQSAPAVSAQAAQKAVGASSRAVLQALKTRDMARLSRYVHPQSGLRFSPYPAAKK